MSTVTSLYWYWPGGGLFSLRQLRSVFSFVS